MSNQKDDLSQGVQNVLSNVPGSGGGGGGAGALSGPDISYSVLWSSTGTDCAPAAGIAGLWLSVTNDNAFTANIPTGALTITGNPPSATAGLSQTVNNSSALQLGGAPFALPANGVDFKSTIKISNHASIFYVGMSSLPTLNAISINPITDPTTVDSVLCACDTGTHYKLVCSKGGIVHTVDSGIPVDALRHTVEITLVGGIATLILDGVIVATYSGPDVPVLSLGVCWYLPTGLAMTADFEYMGASSPTP
jgi:hypothetical protein